MISVVIPLYNKEHTVARALRSVLGQTYQDFEVVVVNDGSTDNSTKVVETFNDPRIRLVHQPNAGVSAARNRGIVEARSDLIAFLDADDEWLPDFLETILGLRAKYPQCSVCATGYERVTPEGCVHPVVLPAGPAESLARLLSDYFGSATGSEPPLFTSAVAAERSALQAVGCFPVGIRNGEDLVTWARLAMSFRIAYHGQSLVRYYSPALLTHRPGRFDPGEDDRVTDALRALAPRVPPKCISSYDRYVGIWHTMCASRMLQYGDRRLARQRVRQAAQCLGMSPKLFAFLALGYLPHSVVLCAFRMSAILAHPGRGLGPGQPSRS